MWLTVQMSSKMRGRSKLRNVLFGVHAELDQEADSKGEV